jgi:hypothetical protein
LAEAQGAGRSGDRSVQRGQNGHVGIGRVGIALGATAIIAGVAVAGFKSFQDQVSKSGELDKFAEGLRLTDSQIEAAGGKVKYLVGSDREVTGLTVTFRRRGERDIPDSRRTRWHLAADETEFTAAFNGSASFGKFTIALLLAGFAALVEVLRARSRTSAGSAPAISTSRPIR